MRIAQRLVLALSLVLLGGCGAVDDAAKDRELPPVEETVFGDVVGTMDRARGVEGALQKHKEERARELTESDTQAR